MNIKEELKVLGSSNDFGANVIKQVIYQQQELASKLHILKVVSLAEKIEDLVSTELFTKADIETVQINFEYDDDDEVYQAEFHLVDGDGEVVASYYDAPDHEQAQVLAGLFDDDLDGFDFELMDKQLRYVSTALELKPGIKEGILKLLLNSELKKIYDYNKMDSELTQTNEKTSRKIKI